jgi:hypothetical protein
MVPKGGLDRLSLRDHAIGHRGAAQGFRPPQGRALLRYSLSAPRRFESPQSTSRNEKRRPGSLSAS